MFFYVEKGSSFTCASILKKVPYRLDIYELLNRKSSRIVRVAAASGVAQEFRIVLPPKIKNSTRSVYSSLYGKFITLELSLTK